MKKFLAVFFAVFMIATVFPFAAFAQTGTEVSGEVVILYTNDVHCNIDNYPLLAAYRAELIAQGKTVITVDAGDAVSGEVIGTLTEGEAVVDIMNSVGYDYAVPGNHEFDYGVDQFIDLAENKAEYEYLSSNFYDLCMYEPVLAPYAVVEANGRKIGFVGISTPETVSKTNPEYFKDENGNFVYGFPAFPGEMTNEALYDNVQDSVNAAKAEGATTVFAISHLGILETTDGWKVTDVLENTSGITAFIDAHSHETIVNDIHKNELGVSTSITQTGEKLGNIGQITLSGPLALFELIDIDDIDVETMSESAQDAYDAVKEKVDGYNEQTAYLFDPIGTSKANLVTRDEFNWLVRRKETNAGDFVCDAYRAVTGADVAICNGGGIRSDILIGDVSRKDLMDMNPWSNPMCVVEMTGEQLVLVLEHGARKCPEPLGSFFQVSGVTYEIHTYVESPIVADSLDNFISIDPDAETRVRNVKVNGEPIDLNKTYTVASSQYVLLDGGDGLTMLDGINVIEKDNILCDSEMLVKYFTETLDGTITAEKYGNPDGEGRIKIYDSEPPVEPDVPDEPDQPDDPADDCTHMCHKDGILGFIWKVIRFFQKIFGLNPVCICGEAHY